MKHSLIVDDSNNVRDFIAKIIDLTWPSGRIMTVCTNAEAKEVLGNNVFDVITSDLVRPGDDGLELIKYIRNDPNGCNWRTPAIAITGQVNVKVEKAKNTELSLYRAGFNAVIGKPFQIDELMHTLSFLVPEQDSDGAPSTDMALLDFGEETPLLDYKELVDLKSKDGIASMAKDVIAMANVGGGKIIVGVREEIPGVFQKVGIQPDTLGTYEVTRLNRAIREYIDPPIHIAVKMVQTDGKHFVIATIPAAQGSPALAKKDNEKAKLWKGRFYIRNTSCESAQLVNNHELRELIARFTRD